MRSKIKIVFYFCAVFCFFCLLSLNRHSKAAPFNYHSEIFADKAGYNVYLPAAFIYGFSNNFPDSLSTNTGYGFSVDTATHRVITKYPYGVSLLQSPFWLVAHFCSTDKSGYSNYYQKSIDTAACFYFTLAIFLLFFTFIQYNNLGQSVWLIALITLGTGIFYYAIFDTGMSHIYSFCCLSSIVYIFYTKNTINTSILLVLLGLLISLFVMVRPVNIVFIIPITLYLLTYGKKLNFNALKKLSYGNIIIFFVVCFLIILPQLCYYKFAYGSFFSNSYQNEPFYFPSVNRITELLFSAKNGLITYYPIIIVLLIYAVYEKSTYLKLIFLLVVTYVILHASWWSLSLGCGFGHRAINDIFLILFLPVVFSQRKQPKIFNVLVAFMCLINLKFILSFDGCLYTKEVWDYGEYFFILTGDFK